MIAKVITDVSLDREFDYLVPDEMAGSIAVGSAVEAPFGRSRRSGYVLALTETSEFAGKLRPLAGFSPRRESVPEHLVRLGRWMADYYCCSQEQAIRTLLPSAVRSGKIRPKLRKLYHLRDTAEAESFLLANAEKPSAKQRVEIVRRLLTERSAPIETLRLLPDFSESSLKTLITHKLVDVTEEVVRRDIFGDTAVLRSQPPEPTDEQKRALALFDDMLDGRTSSKVMLLHGVTNSGKTEVYLQAIRRVVERGFGAIVLVPEISLTPQTVRRFRSRFGDDLSVLHSRLSDGERFDEWNRINSGEVKIVVGARSALFAPFRKLGLIIVDEEHETTYKQSEAPRYHARDVAVMRAKFENAAVILGSATPSAESLYNVRCGKFLLAEMKHQAANQPSPRFTIIDRRIGAPEPGSGESGLFSRPLRAAVEARLEAGEQVILFLNRRGYSRVLTCGACGYEARCPERSANFTYSRARETLACHLCGNVVPAPPVCPECGSPQLAYLGSGTEKIESMARGAFPGARLARMDSDSMRSAADYEEVLEKFRRGDLDILIGTQMISKGLHFPKVTLVGILNADQGLAMPDFRASERVFQQITQVAGRAGRGDRPGEVILQTTHPENEVIEFAARGDFSGFAVYDLEMRELLDYPPFTRLIAVFFRGENESAVADYAEKFKEALTPFTSDVRVAGPLPAPIERIKGRFRYLMTLRGREMRRVRLALRELVLHRRMPDGIEVAVDVDALSLL